MRSIALVTLMLAGNAAASAQNVHEAPANAPARGALADSAEQGTRMTVSGRVVGKDGKAIPGASIFVYQTDANGEYVRGGSGGGSERPRLFAYLRSNAQGRYSFTTVKPGSYPNTNNPGHIHYEVRAAGHDDRVYEIVFENDPHISDNFRREAREAYGGVVIVTPRAAARGLLEVSHDIRIKPR